MLSQPTISRKLIREVANADRWAFLEDLGDRVLEAFSGIRLIGEIERPEGRDTYEELRSRLGQVVKGSETVLSEILEMDSKQMRATFGLYFVWTGIFSYGEESGHELWPQVLEGLGIHTRGQVAIQQFRELFGLCMEENQLERFVELRSGRPYVDRVLLHGLIPEIHIDRFIRDVIYREFQSPMGMFETGGSVVRQLCQGNLSHFRKPIQHFIEHGHPVNADVIGRFLRMASEWDDAESGRWQLWGLPKYMVDAFRDFMEKTPEIGGRNPKPSLSGFRPSLRFDWETNTPVLTIPPQSVPTPPQFVLRYVPIHRQNEVESSWVPENTPVRGQYQTNYVEQRVGPAFNGWRIDVICSSGLHRSLAVHCEFLVTGGGNELPLFFFNARSGKLFNARGKDSFPEELIVVYPSAATLHLVGGETSIESQALHGEWADWRYVACSLAEKGAFEYHGPNTASSCVLTELIEFNRTSERDLPTLSGHNPPSWFRCLEPLPIFTAATPIQIHCRSGLYHLWQRGIGVRRRLDSLDMPTRFELAFQQERQNWTASLPEPSEPGVYELRLQGGLGVEDIAYTFVYFPITRFDAVYMNPDNEESLVRHFEIEPEGEIDLKPHHSAHLEHRENRTIVSPDTGAESKAFCAIRAFAGSRFPVTILLARRDARWCRRRESGFPGWREWLAQPESLPIQRVDELQDAQVAFQIDRRQSADASRGPLRLLLKGTSVGGEDRNLMSLSAHVLRGETHHTWVFDLRKFSDQLDNLREYHTADITIDLGSVDGGDLPLLSLLRFPEYKDLRLTHLTSSMQTEQYEVIWTAQANDPTTRRVLSCRPEDGIDPSVSIPVEDGKLPPFVVELPAPQQPGMWKAWVSIQSSRFAQKQSEAPIESQFRWFRTPEGWQDWLVWPDISHKDLDTKMGLLEALSKDVIAAAFPWTYFLTHFHEKTGREAFHQFQAMIGDQALLQALPIRSGGLLMVKSGDRLCLHLVITESILPRNLHTCFPDIPPSRWHRLPENAELRLRFKFSHHNFEGKVWNYQHHSDQPIAIMSSDKGENFDFNIWLEDALDPASNGTVEAPYPLNFLSEHPQFPALNGVLSKDAIMPSMSISQYERSEPRRRDPRLTIGDIISPHIRQKMELLHPASKETKAKAYRLSEGWRGWATNPRLNSLLSRIVSEYLNTNSAKALSGIAALIVRLKAHGYDSAFASRPDYGSDALLEETLDFVRSYLPRAFLQDLILHEIIVSWYWHKNLARYEEPQASAYSR